MKFGGGYLWHKYHNKIIAQSNNCVAKLTIYKRRKKRGNRAR